MALAVGLCHERSVPKKPKHTRIRRGPLIQNLGEIPKDLRCVEGTRDLAIIPFDVEIVLESLFMGIVLEPGSAEALPNMDTAFLGDAFKECRFAGTVFPDKEGDGARKLQSTRDIEYIQAKRIETFGWILL